MKIAVIGSNGRSGKAFIKLALKRGHEINAGVRNLKNHTNSDNLRYVLCDSRNKEQLLELIHDQDVIVSLIGHDRKSPHDLQTHTMQNLIEAMQELNMDRIVSLTGNGVRIANDKYGIIDKFLNVSIKIIDPNRIQDGITHYQILKDSNLNWTVLRVLKLTNGKPTRFSLSLHGPAKLLTPRDEVAEALLQIIESF